MTPSAKLGSSEWSRRKAIALLGAVLDLPIGALLYVIGGWLLVGVECVAFFLVAIALIFWGARQEMRNA